MGNKNNKRIYNIAVYGSCTSRDPFNSFFNETYKDRYKVVVTDQKHTFISTMQPTIEYDKDDLKIEPNTKYNQYITTCIQEDLDKTFFKYMSENEVDYLIIDVNFDVQRGIIIFDDYKVITNIRKFDRTDYYKKMNINKIFSAYTDPEEYFYLWKIYTNKFFNYLKSNFPNTKVILAEARGISKIKRPDGSTYIDERYVSMNSKYNPIVSKLESYIKENYDVQIIKFYNHILVNEEHKWGKYTGHYTYDYHPQFLRQLDHIIAMDELKKENKLLNQRLDVIENKIKQLKEKS